MKVSDLLQNTLQCTISKFEIKTKFKIHKESSIEIL